MAGRRKLIAYLLTKNLNKISLIVFKRKGMKKLPGVLFLSIGLLSACHNKAAEAAADNDSYTKAKETLEEKEKKNPVRFLTVSSRDKHNLIGEMVVKANIVNNAKVCTYKDIQLELAFYSKTGTLLEKDSETVYDEIAPGNSIDYKTKYYAPKGTDSVAIKIVDAKSD
jgi:hypothetical protein